MLQFTKKKKGGVEMEWLNTLIAVKGLSIVVPIIFSIICTICFFYVVFTVRKINKKLDYFYHKVFPKDYLD